ncbi:MAG: toll/interleukin-1 receptor domain-containing protein [Treponema sp.]
MKVFISHKSEDMEIAEYYAKILKKEGFNIYFDKYDPSIANSFDRASRIESQIKLSTDLLIIITKNTKESWWVPFEIGLSTAYDIRIASLFFKNASSLPSFIRKWPIINTDKKFDIYLEQLKKDKNQLINESIYLKKSMTGESFNFSEKINLNNMRESDLFHDILLSKFEQI